MTQVMKIDALTNNCTLVAVREVTRLPDADILKVFREFGYKDNEGMPTSEWTAAAKKLGLKLERVNTRKEGLSSRRSVAVKNPYYIRDLDDNINHYRTIDPGKFTLADFCREYKRGVYFVVVSGHALVVRNGKVVDHNYTYTLGMRRRVVRAFRVHNPPEVTEKLSPYIKVVKISAKRPGTKAWDRLWDATEYIRRKGEVTKNELLLCTSYTLLDFNHDMKKGIIAYKEEA